MLTFRFWIGHIKPDHTKIDRHQAAWKAMTVALLTSNRERSFEELQAILQMTEMEFEIGSTGDLIRAVKEDAEG